MGRKPPRSPRRRRLEDANEPASGWIIIDSRGRLIEFGDEDFVHQGGVGATAARFETGADEETLEFGFATAVLLELAGIGVENAVDERLDLGGIGDL